MRFNLRKVDFNNLVVESRRICQHLIISTEFGCIHLCERCNFFTACLAEILAGILVEWEDRACGTQFGSHVTNGSLAGGRDAVQSLAEVFEDGVGSALYGKNAEDFENHILRSGPAREFTCEMHTNETWHLEFPRLTGQHIYGISTTYTYGHHAETTSIRSMRIGTHHHTSRECIVFEHYLMDDSGTRSPESDMIFLRNRLQEVIYLFISLTCLRKVLRSAHIGTNQVITMYGSRYGHLVLTRIHELQECHLRSRILHRHAIRTEVNIFYTSFIWSQLCRVEKMRKEHLLGISKRSFHRSLSLGYTFRIRSVKASQHFNVQYHLVHNFN